MSRMQQLPTHGTNGHMTLLRGISPIVSIKLELLLVPQLILPQFKSIGIHSKALFQGIGRNGRDWHDSHSLVKSHPLGNGVAAILVRSTAAAAHGIISIGLGDHRGGWVVAVNDFARCAPRADRVHVGKSRKSEDVILLRSFNRERMLHAL